MEEYHPPMDYRKISFPLALFAKFVALAAKLGWGKRGDRWKFLDLVLDYANDREDLFRKR